MLQKSLKILLRKILYLISVSELLVEENLCLILDC